MTLQTESATFLYTSKCEKTPNLLMGYPLTEHQKVNFNYSSSLREQIIKKKDLSIHSFPVYSLFFV